MWFRRGPVVVLFVLGSWCLPAHAANLFTVNSSDGQGVSGTLLATPPGTCTGVPGPAGAGAVGDCSLRAAQAALDWAQGYYDGARWSDAVEAEAVLPSGAQRILLNGTADPIGPGDMAAAINTNIGASWIPASCNRPWCGNLLRGDVISHIDENGDGVWDDTWIDSNFNGVVENGEVDRTRAEQFAWGLTSVMRELADLSLVQGNVSPPGISRMRVRLALGDAALDPAAECDGDVANPACLDAAITVPGPGDDAAIFGKCDPDRFAGLDPLYSGLDPVAAQRALDNCLWFYASFPVTAPSPGSFDPLHSQLRPDGEGLDPLTDPFARRDSWIDQRVVKYTASVTPEQDFAQSWLVTYGFKAAPDTDDLGEAIYQNEWRMAQSDSGTDTYPYTFLIQHTAEARRRGFTQDPAVPVDECIPPLGGVTCDGMTNPTVDPFWGKAIVRTGVDLNGDGVLDPDLTLSSDGSFTLDFGQGFEFFDGQPCDEACRESGVGHETGFTFLYEQEVEGYLLSCLNCGHPAPASADTVTYTFTWPGLPVITALPYPPPPTTALPVLP
ncbi:MAG: hypothetical protein AB1451_01890 [Nitrospirota bacterium]